MKNSFLLAIFVTLSVLVKGQNNTNLIESNNRFTFDVYAKVKKTESNIVLSPLSITSAIAMTYIGAEANTSEEISKTFYFTQDKDALSKDYLSLLGYKNSTDGVTLYNANSLWVQKGLVLNKHYTDINKNFFNSSLHTADFMNTPEKSRLTINSWVEKNTNNRIKDLIKPLAIDNTTRLVLVNALYFKAPWSKPFRKEQNTIGKFQVGKNDFVNTTFMNNTINSWYYHDKCTEIIDLPYANKQYSLMIIIPKSYTNLNKIEKALSYGFYKNYIDNKQLKRINLSIPKFDIESEFDLNKTLSDLGIKEAFSESADFSGITKQEKLYISQVVHKANITINEEGTEAAAATAVMMSKTSIISDLVEFKVDKPFIFILRNNETNLVYFIGKVVKPELIQ